MRGLWPPVVLAAPAGLTSSKPYGLLCPPSPKEASVEITEISAGFKGTLLFHQVPARPGPPSRPRSASPGLRPAGALFLGARAPRGPSSAPTPRTLPCSPPARDGAPSTNGTQGGGGAGSDIAGPPHLLLPIKSKMVTQRRVGERPASCSHC